MHFHIVSLFPEFFSSPLQAALMAKAQEAGLVSCSLHNPREYGHGVHKAVDDRPYGGGPGMVFMLDPLVKTLRKIQDISSDGTMPASCTCANTPSHDKEDALAICPVPLATSSQQKAQRHRILVMSPAGKPFTQAMAKELAKEAEITLVCGRYEGFDARLEDIFPIEYVSMGDAVLNGGEVPALAIMEAVSRLIPGFMGKEASGSEESFSDSLLEYPHYTRPEIFEGHAVPEVLRSGDHARIAAWRKEASLKRTLRQRPDLLQQAPLDKIGAHFLAGLSHTRPGKNLYLALVHHPVIIEGKNSGTSSLTNLDIHDIARLCRTYGLGGYYIVQPLQDQQEVLQGILRHWLHGPASKSHADRAEALKLVQLTASIAEAQAHIHAQTGEWPLLWGSSAQWGEQKSHPTPDILPFDVARQKLGSAPALLLLGTGHGLAPEVLHNCDGFLRPLRFLSDYNHLSVRAAAAILVDRILQDIY